MTRKTTTLLLVAVLVLTIAAPSAAQIKPSFNANAGVLSKYVWRGGTVNDGPVRQGSLSATLAGATVGLWASADLDNTNLRSGDFTEVDSWFDYGRRIGLLSVNGGVLHYGYPDAAGDTSELYVTGSIAALLTPTLSIYRDLDAVRGTYANLGVSHAVPLVNAQTLYVTGAVGYGSDRHNGAYYAGSDAGLVDFAASASWTWFPIAKLAVTPKVTWATLLSETSDTVEAADGKTNAVVGSLGANFTF